jgi:hypothetical protein
MLPRYADGTTGTPQRSRAAGRIGPSPAAKRDVSPSKSRRQRRGGIGCCGLLAVLAMIGWTCVSVFYVWRILHLEDGAAVKGLMGVVLLGPGSTWAGHWERHARSVAGTLEERTMGFPGWHAALVGEERAVEGAVHEEMARFRARLESGDVALPPVPAELADPATASHPPTGAPAVDEGPHGQLDAGALGSHELAGAGASEGSGSTGTAVGEERADEAARVGKASADTAAAEQKAATEKPAEAAGQGAAGDTASPDKAASAAASGDKTERRAAAALDHGRVQREKAAAAEVARRERETAALRERELAAAVEAKARRAAEESAAVEREREAMHAAAPHAAQDAAGPPATPAAGDAPPAAAAGAPESAPANSPQDPAGAAEAHAEAHAEEQGREEGEVEATWKAVDMARVWGDTGARVPIVVVRTPPARPPARPPGQRPRGRAGRGVTGRRRAAVGQVLMDTAQPGRLALERTLASLAAMPGVRGHHTVYVSQDRPGSEVNRIIVRHQATAEARAPRPAPRAPRAGTERRPRRRGGAVWAPARGLRGLRRLRGGRGEGGDC